MSMRLQMNGVLVGFSAVTKITEKGQHRYWYSKNLIKPQSEMLSEENGIIIDFWGVKGGGDIIAVDL